MTRKEALEKVKSVPIKPDIPISEQIVNFIYDNLEGTLKDEKLGPWDWVKTEYVAMFKAKNPDKGGHVKESVSRMKKMFAANPEIRKEDVLLTVKLYLSQTDSRFIRLPHYFLKKGQGANAIYEFDTWYEKYLEGIEAGKGRSNVINTMQ